MLLPFKNNELFKRVKRIVEKWGHADLKCQKADDFFATDSLMETIASKIKAASLVIADLTGRNPNVFYELGLAHAWHKPVILLAKRSEDVPSDLRAQRYYQYDITKQAGTRALGVALRGFLDQELSEQRKRGTNVADDTASGTSQQLGTGFPTVFAGAWDFQYGPQKHREYAQIDRNGVYSTEGQQRYRLIVQTYNPEQEIIWDKVDIHKNAVKSREKLAIVSQDQLDGYGHNDPKHTLVYTRRQPDTQQARSTTDEIKRDILNTRYRLFFNPKTGHSSQSKLMRFAEGGVILEGKNHNEASWRIRNGFLELLTSVGQVHSRFRFDPARRRFDHTNDEDTLSISRDKKHGQFMVPE
jgi:nucleoside 2-deoxyribosyltransferase